MTFVYCDAALANEQGHFAPFCRATTTAVRQLGGDVLVLGHARIEPDLAAALGATPFFRFHPNATLCDDPLCGPLTDFVQAARITAADLARLTGFTADNIVFYEHAKAAQLMGLIDWAQTRFPSDNCPLIVVTFGWPGGLEEEAPAADQTGGSRWRIGDQRMIFYRHASRMIRPSHVHRFAFAAYDPKVASAYRFLLDRPVQVFPPPLGAVTAPRDRTETAAPTVAFLGEQRLEKGLALIPEMVRQLLAAHPSIRIIVHNSWQEPRDENTLLAGMAKEYPRLEVRLGTVTAAEWAELLDRTDMLVMPYDPAIYATAISGVAVEAIATGIPCVAPRGTTMERLLTEAGMPGVLADRSEVEPMVTAVSQLLSDYPPLAARAAQASQVWQERAGGKRLVEAILSCRQRQASGA